MAGKDLDAFLEHSGDGADVTQHKDDIRPPKRNEKVTTNTIHYPQYWNDDFKEARESNELLPSWTRYMRMALRNQLIKDGIIKAD